MKKKRLVEKIFENKSLIILKNDDAYFGFHFIEEVYDPLLSGFDRYFFIKKDTLLGQDFSGVVVLSGNVDESMDLSSFEFLTESTNIKLNFEEDLLSLFSREVKLYEFLKK